MSDAMSFVEIDGQHVELLPARTVLSLFSVGAPKGDAGAPAGGAPAAAAPAAAAPAPGIAGGPGGYGGEGSGKAGFMYNWIYIEDGNMTTTLTGGAGGAAPGGAASSGAGPAAPAR